MGFATSSGSEKEAAISFTSGHSSLEEVSELLECYGVCSFVFFRITPVVLGNFRRVLQSA